MGFKKDRLCWRARKNTRDTSHDPQQTGHRPATAARGEVAIKNQISVGVPCDDPFTGYNGRDDPTDC